MKDIILPGQYVKGCAQPYRHFDPNQDGGYMLFGNKEQNLVCYDWGAAAAALFRGVQDGKSYKIGGMYLEFDNSGSAVDPTPSFTRDSTPDYYRNLTGTADFLRVPLIASSGSSTSESFSADNIATFYAQSTGTTGERTTSPLTFSDANNSRVYGAALVVFRDEEDITQDLIVSRIYFDTDNQVEKPASGQVGVTWTLSFA